MQLAAYDPPRAVTAAELAALGVSGRQRALLLKHDALPSPPFPFEYYATPSLVSLAPDRGPAAGGFTVTVRGRGFRALTHGGVAGGGGRAAQPVCRFGATAAAATVASDAVVRCVAPWGVGGRRSRVSLALNGVDAAADGLWLTFEGRSRAHVVAATLADDATAVSLRFGTPTDRGGATPGLSDCTPLLTNASLALVGGAAAQCAWPSARELRVHLGAAAPLRAGDAISVRAGVIAPRGWAGSCADEGELCASGGATVRPRRARGAAGRAHLRARRRRRLRYRHTRRLSLGGRRRPRPQLHVARRGDRSALAAAATAAAAAADDTAAAPPPPSPPPPSPPPPSPPPPAPPPPSRPPRRRRRRRPRRREGRRRRPRRRLSRRRRRRRRRRPRRRRR